MKIAIYPGTFDPITLGHIDIIQRASRLFKTLIVAVSENPTKQPLFSLQQRVEWITRSVSSWNNIEIIGFDNLLVECAQYHHADVIVRGIRNEADVEHEMQLARINRLLKPDLETIFLTASAEVAFISSSLVRELLRYKGDPTGLVPEAIVEHLKQMNVE